MAIEIKMPRLGQISNEIILINWFVKEGQKIKKGDLLCEVETDKAIMDVESFESGTVLKLYVKPDTVVSAGTVIATLGKPKEKVKEILKAEKKKKIGENIQQIIEKKLITKQVIDKTEDVFKATSLVKNIAKKKNINLEYVKGTGPGGIITKEDLEEYLKSSKTKKGIMEKENIYPLTQSQRAVAINLTRSKKEIPHYYLKTDLFIDSALNWIESNKNIDGKKISINSLFIYAVARALKKFPKLNGYFKDNKIILKNKIHIGFAVARGDELYVPVIRNTDKKGIIEIDKEVKQLVEKTQNKKLESSDISRGTFTITNLGMYDIDEFYSIINYPQSAIIAIGRIKKTLYINEDNSMCIKNICSVTGSFDHRIVNGSQGAEFIEEIKKTLEEI